MELPRREIQKDGEREEKGKKDAREDGDDEKSRGTMMRHGRMMRGRREERMERGGTNERKTRINGRR